MQSAVKLLNQRAYRDVSVLDIVRDCDINRNTFYYHFKDMPALLDEIVRSKIDSILSEYYCDDALEHLRFQRASAVCMAALPRRGLSVEPAQISPQYLRLPQAQRELLQKQNKI